MKLIVCLFMVCVLCFSPAWAFMYDLSVINYNHDENELVLYFPKRGFENENTVDLICVFQCSPNTILYEKEQGKLVFNLRNFKINEISVSRLFDSGDETEEVLKGRTELCQDDELYVLRFTSHKQDAGEVFHLSLISETPYLNLSTVKGGAGYDNF